MDDHDPDVSRETRIARRALRRNGRILLITALAALLFLVLSRLGG